MSSSSPSLHCPAASSVDAAPSTRLLTLQDFGVSAGTTMKQLLQEHGSFELLAWYGDQLLERFVSERIWERAMKAVDDAAAASDASSTGAARSVHMTAASLSDSISPQMLHDERVRFTANRALAQYLKHATEIRPPHGYDEHAYGTAFEFLLCLAQRTRGVDFVRQRVHEYMDWRTEHGAPSPSVRDPIESVSLLLRWPSSDDSEWILSTELDCYRGRWTILSSRRGAISETSAVFISRLISNVKLSRKRQQWSERELTAERRQSAARLQAKLARMAAQVEEDPFCNVAVPAAEIAVMSGDLEVISMTAPQSKHTGAVVQVPWRSRKKISYLEPFWSCCGMRGATKQCNRPNWARSTYVHTGEMEIPTGTNTHRMGGGIGSVPVGQFPKWTCCGQTSIAQGCKAPELTSESSKAADVVTVTPAFTDGEDLRLSGEFENESAGSRTAVRAPVCSLSRNNDKGGGGSIVWHEAASSSIPRVMPARSVNDWNPGASASSVGTWTETLSYPAVGINESGPARKNSDARRAERDQLFEQQKAADAAAATEAKGQRGCFAKLLSFLLWTVSACPVRLRQAQER